MRGFRSIQAQVASGIADGTIVNADVNASAAILMSKLSNTYLTTDALTFRDVPVWSDAAGRLKIDGIGWITGKIFNALIENPNGSGIANPINVAGINLSSGTGAPSGGADGDVYVRINGANTAMHLNVNGSWTTVTVV
ncbi:MAG: hypothetical protein ACE5DX_05435 [Candidatus Dojkabacteria bacterium]